MINVEGKKNRSENTDGGKARSNGTKATISNIN